MSVVMWFRRDLRLEDNTALNHALRHDDVYLVFHVNQDQFLEGTNNHNAFFLTLKSFKEEVDQMGHLHILYGDITTCFTRLTDQLDDLTDVYANEDDTGYGAKRDALMEAFFQSKQISFHVYQDHYLHGAHDVLTKQGTMYKVFTPYYRQWVKMEKQLPTIGHISLSKQSPLFASDEAQYVAMLEKLQPIHDFDPSAFAAKQRMQTFIHQHLCDYHVNRDLPILDATSHLSADLRTGVLSIRTLYHEVNLMPPSDGKEVFIKELCWRDFYHQAYVMFPHAKTQAIIDVFNQIEWENHDVYFNAWKNGETGYPIVDAGMRQLKKTGWMHNRLRMIVASFLVKDLGIDWRLGEAYFQRMLIDYDPCSNVMGWQWAASTGLDAVPYFRIFNPFLQAKRFDPKALFIKQYIPELSHLSAKTIHSEQALQKERGDYPQMIVDHQKQRNQSLQRFKQAQKQIT